MALVHFVGAGCGAADLITVRGMRLLQQCDVCIYTGSLVSAELLDWTRPACERYNSAQMTLEQVLEVIVRAEDEGKTTVRLHTGEQYAALDALGIPYDVCPGVSAFCGAAASLRCAYTQPEGSQTVILSRQAGRTSVPEREAIASLAVHQASMVLYLSTTLTETLQSELLAGGYAPDTPCAIVYKATWPDEKIFRCPLRSLHETAAGAQLRGHALILVGAFLNPSTSRSKLYDAHFSTGYREAL